METFFRNSYDHHDFDAELQLVTNVYFIIKKKVEKMNQNSSYMPRFDKEFIKQYSDKYYFLKSLPELIQSQLDVYTSYFMTVTFKNTHYKTKYDRYRQYFRYFYRNLNQYTLSRSRTNHTKSIIILIPEESYHCVSSQKFACTHFHSILFVHNNNLQRFNRRCVLAKDDADRIYFNEKLLSPYPETSDIAVKRSDLVCCSHHVKKLNYAHDIYKTAFYINKNFVNSSFEYDQMMLFSKLYKA